MIMLHKLTKLQSITLHYIKLRTYPCRDSGFIQDNRRGASARHDPNLLEGFVKPSRCRCCLWHFRAHLDRLVRGSGLRGRVTQLPHAPPRYLGARQHEVKGWDGTITSMAWSQHRACARLDKDGIYVQQATATIASHNK
jgi:hypothetical protein